MRRSKEHISRNMSQIRNKGSQIEKMMASALRKKRFRYRGHAKIIGRPDFILQSHKIAIFCDSAFWNGYKFGLKSRHEFKTNKRFWKNKILKNIERDKIVNRHLKKDGWLVMRFWDFDIKKDISKCIRKIQRKIEAQK